MKADRWSHHGRASLPTTLTCTCGDAGGLCLVCETERETELGCGVGLDGTRPMPAPMRTPEDYAYHTRIARCIAAVSTLGWYGLVALLIALLKSCGARTLTP